MKHIKEPPPPLPAELPPNVRELIEITLVKNPQMRYRSGGPFADAVAAVRAGRRPPRPSQSPPPGRASPAAIPSSPQARVAAVPGRSPAARRSRPSTGGHRPPPARRTFSSGQRALLWAAGVLGALAIIIAVLIVINSRSESPQQAPPPTVTDTGTPPATAPPPSKTPTGAGPGMRLNWTDRGTIGNSGLQNRPPHPSRVIRVTPGPSPARHETPR
jgi:serine/threonine-protein kinase